MPQIEFIKIEKYSLRASKNAPVCQVLNEDIKLPCEMYVGKKRVFRHANVHAVELSVPILAR